MGRRHIPIGERYAAVLAEMLPEEVRADLQRRRVPWQEVEKEFKKRGQIDHNITVRTKEIVRWWNLNFLWTDDHKVKTASDAKVHAKADRFERLRLTGDKKTEAQKRRSQPFPKGQKIKSRGFPSKEERQRWKDRLSDK